MTRCVLALLAAMALPAQATPPLAGTWFGYGQPWDKSAMYVDTMRPDGTFHAHHRFCLKGKSNDQYEDGLWAFDKGILTIHVQTVNGKFEPRVDDYKIVSVNAKEERYIYLAMNFPYSAKRVDAKFQMPNCDLVS